MSVCSSQEMSKRGSIVTMVIGNIYHYTIFKKPLRINNTIPPLNLPLN
jgi:hypothetical protein